jgi:integrase
MASTSLSPKRATERMQRFQSAVRTIALFKAKKAVQAQIRARGQRVSDYSCRDISLMAAVELERDREELINKATANVLTFPEFAGLDIASVWKGSRNRTLAGESSGDHRTKSAMTEPTPTAANRTLPRRQPNITYRQREYLTEKEVERLIEAARKRGRNGPRDAAAILLAYRHGLRAVELCQLRWTQVDLRSGRLHVNRSKGGIESVHPLHGPDTPTTRQLALCVRD